MYVHTLVGEVAPLAPLIVLLGEWCGLIFALGCVFVVGYFVTAIAGTLAGFSVHLPFIGDPVANIIHKAERAVTDKLGQAESFLDAKAGGAWHEMARLLDWTYREMRSHANLLYTIAGLMVGPAAVGAIRAGISVLHGNVHAAQHRITSTYARVLHLEHRLQHTITAGVLPRIGRLEREYDHVIDRDIAGLRSRTKAIEGQYTKLWDYVRSHPWTIVTDATVAAVAVSLGRLGLNWLRCPSLGRLGRRVGCGGFDLLEELFAASLTAFAVTDLCDFAAGVQVVAEELVPAFMALVDVEDALVDCHGATRPPDLPLPRRDYPPVSSPLPLAA